MAFKVAQRVSMTDPDHVSIVKGAIAYNGDSMTHQWEVTVTDGSVSGSAHVLFVLPDNTNFTQSGTISGNVITASFPQAAYSQLGQVKAYMQVVNGSNTSTIAAIRFVVTDAATGAIHVPDDVVLSYSGLMSELNTLSTRIDSIVAGSTPSGTEVTDARIDGNNKTYTTLRDRINTLDANVNDRMDAVGIPNVEWQRNRYYYGYGTYSGDNACIGTKVFRADEDYTVSVGSDYIFIVNEFTGSTASLATEKSTTGWIPGPCLINAGGYYNITLARSDKTTAVAVSEHATLRFSAVEGLKTILTDVYDYGLVQEGIDASTGVESADERQCRTSAYVPIEDIDEIVFHDKKPRIRIHYYKSMDVSAKTGLLDWINNTTGNVYTPEFPSGCKYVKFAIGDINGYKITPEQCKGLVSVRRNLKNAVKGVLINNDNSVIDNTYVSSYNTIGYVDDQIADFAKIFKDIEHNGDGFLFFTDPHIVYKSGWQRRLRDAMAYVEYIANSAPVSFVLNGGDWLGSYNTQDEAAVMLSTISGTMRNKFGKNYAMLVGNHDTNYQGYIDDSSKSSDPNNHNGILKQGAIDRLYSTITRKSYFRFDAPTFALYCFDTGIESNDLSGQYYKDQIQWFANSLLSGSDEHIVVAMHILFNGSEVKPMADEITKCAKAFNERSTYTYDGHSYSFANAVGKVAFAIAGHTHSDSSGVVNSIPYVITTNAGDYGNLKLKDRGFPLDLCAIDWDNKKLYMYRCAYGKTGGQRSDSPITIIADD